MSARLRMELSRARALAHVHKIKMHEYFRISGKTGPGRSPIKKEEEKEEKKEEEKKVKKERRRRRRRRGRRSRRRH